MQRRFESGEDYTLPQGTQRSQRKGYISAKEWRFFLWQAIFSSASFAAKSFNIPLCSLCSLWFNPSQFFGEEEGRMDG